MTTETTTDNDAGLKAKNAELLGKLKKAQADLEQLASDKEDAETEAATKAGDIEKIKQQLEAKHKKEIDALRSSNEQLSTDLRSIRVDNEINQAISTLGIITAHVPAVEALMHRKVQYDDGVATIDGKSITDWAKDWTAKDGAIYRPAPNNSGANVSSSDGTISSQFTIPKSAADVTPELQKLAVSDPAQYNSIMDTANLPQLKV